jgi:TolB-like protein/thioredoxin-like negative regulator of GroEL
LKRQDRLVEGPGGTIELSARAFDLLCVLLDHPGEVVSKDALFDAVWPGVVVEENTLQVHVSALRRALGADMIATVHGRGYRYAGPMPVELGAGAPKARAGPRDRKPVIVVLPFENLSDDPEQQYFSDGITGDITDRLVRFRKFAVIGQYSASMFRSASPDFAAIRATLKADFVVTGTVRRAGERIRITLRLSNLETGDAIWAERYDRPISDIFALQDEISELVASTIASHLDIEMTVQIASRTARSLSSYEHTLKGYWQFRKLTPESRLEARHSFEQAVAADPSNAEAIGWLAMAHCEEWVHDFNEAYAISGAALAAKATALDPMSATCCMIESWTSLCVGNLDAALGCSEKGMALNPSDPNLLVNRALALGYDGRYAEATELMAKAFRLEPLPPLWFAEFKGVIDFAEGLYEETLAGVEHLDFAWDNMYALACYAHLGRSEQAKAMLAELKQKGRAPDWQRGIARQPFRDAKVRDRLREGVMAALSWGQA